MTTPHESTRGGLLARQPILGAAALLAVAAVGCGTAETPPVWETLPLGTRADFRGLSFAGASHGWIAGGGFEIPGGLIGHTADGGRTWRFTSGLIGTADRPRRLGLVAAHFFDERRGLVAADTGAILLTSDAGDTWEPADVRGRRGTLAGMFFLDEQRGWAAGANDVLRTDDGGRTWTTITADMAGGFHGRAMHFTDAATGWLAGMHASLLRTADGGVTWESQAIPVAPGERPSFWDVHFVDGVHGWVVGEEGSIFTTRDAGATWSAQSTGLADARSAPRLERIPRAGGLDVIDAGDRTPGLTLRAVRFVSPERGWAAGGYAGLGRSIILATTDAGATWTVEAEIAGEDLTALFVQGREWIWAVGARVREGGQSIYRRPMSAPPVRK
jgi:photosystem II stability/assembly factor-like uncharacterized protein